LYNNYANYGIVTWKTGEDVAISSDRIAYMEERELYRTSIQMKEALTSIRRRDPKDTRISKIETDLCYVHRELEIRDARRKAHKEFKRVLREKRYSQ
tara:strand:- start:1031 stop:1321 length:291 start_codon:yes stop_codon:yes gene_type:complete